MKFGKEFESQMVPEWQNAYMDYNYLKNILRDIRRFKQRNRPRPPPPPPEARPVRRMLTLYRSFSGLTRRSSPTAEPVDVENQAILVSSVGRAGVSEEEGYETMFLMAADEGGEFEVVYFSRLDDEFNKVVKFHKGKVEEVMKEAETLNKQMDALIAFRIKVDGGGGRESSEEISRLASEVAASTAALAASTPSGARASRRAAMEIIAEEGSVISQGQSDESSDDKDIKESKTTASQLYDKEKKPKKTRDFFRPAPLEILGHVRMNNIMETPRSTIKGFLGTSTVGNHEEIKFTNENLKKVQHQLKRALIEFYNKLRLLKNYSFLNLLAFSKIMKKYDKITSRNASKSYLKMVDNSYLGSSDEVTKLMERVEATFIKHFANSNRSKGMNILRPKVKKERHRVTFSVGFMVGCTTALIIALFSVTRARNILYHPNRNQYIDTMFPLNSLFGFIILHMLMYAANVYFWRRYRVNYSFIFGFKEGTELGSREVLLLGFGLSMLVLTAVLVNLDLEMDPKTKDFKAISELVPLGLVAFVILVMFCPFNIIYRSSRYFFLVCVFHCLCAPLYKVTLPDFFLADQLTSQVQAIRSFEFYICYYGWGDYKHRQNTCKENHVYTTFYFILAAVPYWSRLLQCLRRLYEERDAMQGLNGLKYFSTIVAVSMRTAYTVDRGIGWRVIAWIASATAAIFSTYWDLKIDWGLFQKNSKNRWLRDKLLVPHKSVYFVAIVLNVGLRFAWLQTVLDTEIDSLHRQTTTIIVAFLEIIRRGIWNFFRLENEHLNNVGKYRAFKSVPLPFNYDEDESKDE